MAHGDYERQVRLLVATLPAIERQPAFALKGGTAINLFYRYMPRLFCSVLLTCPLRCRHQKRAEIGEYDGKVDWFRFDAAQQGRKESAATSS